MAEFPEAELVRKTFTVKQMDLPPSVQMTKRSLLRWFALSFGLISEQESRDTVLNVLDALFHFLLNKKQQPTTLEIQEYLDSKFKKKVSEKLIRYHLNRLIALELIQRKQNRYRVNSSPNGDQGDLVASFSRWVKGPVNDSLDSIEKVLGKLSDSYRK